MRNKKKIEFMTNIKKTIQEICGERKNIGLGIYNIILKNANNYIVNKYCNSQWFLKCVVEGGLQQYMIGNYTR